MKNIFLFWHQGSIDSTFKDSKIGLNLQKCKFLNSFFENQPKLLRKLVILTPILTHFDAFDCKNEEYFPIPTPRFNRFHFQRLENWPQLAKMQIFELIFFESSYEQFCNLASHLFCQTGQLWLFHLTQVESTVSALCHKQSLKIPPAINSNWLGEKQHRYAFVSLSKCDTPLHNITAFLILLCHCSNSSFQTN